MLKGCCLVHLMLPPLLQLALLLTAACLQCCRYKCRYFWSHSQSDELSGNRYVAIQRMAQAAGLAYMDPISHLCLHPKFGPWIALRCALVFEGTQYTGPRKTPLVNRLSPSTEQYVQMAMKSAQRQPSMSLEDAGNWDSSDCFL